MPINQYININRENWAIRVHCKYNIN